MKESMTGKVLDTSKLRRLDAEETKGKLLELLIKFDSFCKEHELRYFLSGGTLLGAVRHKGFIPWDDDIDVMMPRPDYNKLKALTAEMEQEKAGIYAFDYTNEPSYFYPFLKVVDPHVFIVPQLYERYRPSIVPDYYNLFLDVFPLDGIAENKFRQFLFFLRFRTYKKLITLSIRRVGYLFSGSNIFFRIIKTILLTPPILISRLFGHVYFLRKIETLSTKVDFDESRLAGAIVGMHGKKELLDKSQFNETVKLEFENLFFNAPVGYEQYLKSIYGDYMRLPPEKDRLTHLAGEIYTYSD